MARPKKETVVSNTSTKTTTPRQATKPTQREKDLEAQVASLTKMMQELQKMIGAKEEAPQSVPETPQTLNEIFSLPTEQVQEAIPFREYIRVMSLTNHRLSISTEAYGQGTVYNFTNFGQVQSIFYDDLAKIIHNNDRCTSNEQFFFSLQEDYCLNGFR